MALSFGNISIKDMYYGSIKIGSAYLGSTKVYSSELLKPYLIFEFSELDFVPTNNLISSDYNNYATWTQVSTNPNIWKLEISQWVVTSQEQAGRGLPFLFCSSSGSNEGKLIPENINNGYCILRESGNFDVQINGYYCTSLDRMFANCTGLHLLQGIIHCTTVTNVGGMFKGCTNIQSGALDQYNWFNTYGVNITNHSGTFASCGENTQTGLAELNQIPVGWGGNLIPASTLMISTRQTYANSNRYTSWKITGNNPDWTAVSNGMYLFTEGSVAQYSGVSMNRSRIPNTLNGLGTSQGSYALYFYPAFVQCSQIPGKSGNNVSWVVTTDNPNGYLTTSQGNTDMPGTLDYSSFGPFTREYGTYDSTMDVYFTFLVTNVPIAQWGGLTDAMGFLYSTYYNSDASLRYFF